jgi:transcriptional regulator with XRE-family HTH domain
MPRSKKIQHDEIVTRFGQRLREVRVSRSMSQAELAKQAHVTTNYISKLEKGGSASGIDLVAHLATALGTTIADLLPTTPPPDDLAVLREQIRGLGDSVIESEDRQMLSYLAQFLARLSETLLPGPIPFASCEDYTIRPGNLGKHRRLCRQGLATTPTQPARFA